MVGFIAACSLSFGVVFLAELGDKSQLMALTFATRYRALSVLTGMALAAAVVNGVSVAVGAGLGAAIPTHWVTVVAAVFFLGFGVWALRGEVFSGMADSAFHRSGRSAVGAVATAFVLAELGDKTMLATITLATQHGWFGIWVGSILGMVAASGCAIAVGKQLGSRLPATVIRYGAGVAFLVFGGWLAVDAVRELSGISPWATLWTLMDLELFGWVALAVYLAGLVAVFKWSTLHRWHPQGIAPPPIPSLPSEQIKGNKTSRFGRFNKEDPTITTSTKHVEDEQMHEALGVGEFHDRRRVRRAGVVEAEAAKSKTARGSRRSRQARTVPWLRSMADLKSIDSGDIRSSGRDKAS